jgi:hypothetical protein
VDLFPCDSIVLRSYWVLVVMEQFTVTSSQSAWHCGPVNGADICRMFNAAIRGRGHTHDISSPIMIRSSHCRDLVQLPLRSQQRVRPRLASVAYAVSKPRAAPGA